MQTDVQSIPLKGGEFIVKDAEYGQTFIPEQFGEESLMVAKAAQDFLENEINPVAARIEVQEEGLSKSLMIKIGELGFLGIHMPEIYGGSDLDTNTNTLVTDILGPWVLSPQLLLHTRVLACFQSFILAQKHKEVIIYQH